MGRPARNETHAWDGIAWGRLSPSKGALGAQVCVFFFLFSSIGLVSSSEFLSETIGRLFPGAGGQMGRPDPRAIPIQSRRIAGGRATTPTCGTRSSALAWGQTASAPGRARRLLFFFALQRSDLKQISPSFLIRTRSDRRAKTCSNSLYQSRGRIAAQCKHRSDLLKITVTNSDRSLLNKQSDLKNFRGRTICRSVNRKRIICRSTENSRREQPSNLIPHDKDHADDPIVLSRSFTASLPG
jgi:hypothetical protein